MVKYCPNYALVMNSFSSGFSLCMHLDVFSRSHSLVSLRVLKKAMRFKAVLLKYERLSGSEFCVQLSMIQRFIEKEKWYKSQGFRKLEE